MPSDALTRRVRDDLSRIAHPRMRWLEPRTGPDGQPAGRADCGRRPVGDRPIAHGLLRAQVPSLGYQAWHEDRYRPAAWAALDQISRTDWVAVNQDERRLPC